MIPAPHHFHRREEGVLQTQAGEARKIAMKGYPDPSASSRIHQLRNVVTGPNIGQQVLFE